LVAIEVHYMEKNPGIFSSKTYFLFDWRKKNTDILDVMGVISKLSGNFYLKKV